jgi:hypothetical protein
MVKAIPDKPACCRKVLLERLRLYSIFYTGLYIPYRTGTTVTAPLSTLVLIV